MKLSHVRYCEIRHYLVQKLILIIIVVKSLGTLELQFNQ